MNVIVVFRSFWQVSRAIQDHDMARPSRVCLGSSHNEDPFCRLIANRSTDCAVGLNYETNRLLANRAR